jgi:hypothetical protein
MGASSQAAENARSSCRLQRDKQNSSGITTERYEAPWTVPAWPCRCPHGHGWVKAIGLQGELIEKFAATRALSMRRNDEAVVANVHITFDCDDVLMVASFWSAVLGRPLDEGSSELFASIGGADGARQSRRGTSPMSRGPPTFR